MKLRGGACIDTPTTHESIENLNAISKEIINLTQTVGFSDIDNPDIIGYFNLEAKSAVFELINLSNQSGEDKENSQISLAKLSEAFDCIKKAMQIFEEIDKDEERVVSIKRTVNSSLKH